MGALNLQVRAHLWLILALLRRTPEFLVRTQYRPPCLTASDLRKLGLEAVLHFHLRSPYVVHRNLGDSWSTGHPLTVGMRPMVFRARRAHPDRGSRTGRRAGLADPAPDRLDRDRQDAGCLLEAEVGRDGLPVISFSLFLLSSAVRRCLVRGTFGPASQVLVRRAAATFADPPAHQPKTGAQMCGAPGRGLGMGTVEQGGVQSDHARRSRGGH